MHSSRMGYKKYFPRSSLTMYLTSLGHHFALSWNMHDDRGKLIFITMMTEGSSNFEICLATLSTHFLFPRHFQAFSNQLTLNLLEKSKLLALVSSNGLDRTPLKNGT